VTRSYCSFASGKTDNECPHVLEGRLKRALWRRPLLRGASICWKMAANNVVDGVLEGEGRVGRVPGVLRCRTEMGVRVEDVACA